MSAADRLAQRLESELGRDAVKLDAQAAERYAVAGKAPRVVCFPSSAEQVASILRLSSEAEAAVVPWGGGTAMRVGNPPRRCDLVLCLGCLDRVVEHDPANLTVIVECGITLRRLQESLAPHRQFFAVDPPRPGDTTIGGIVAANLNGPRRASHGAVRDLVIGLKAALPSGERIKAGGKVVKNVAGYDMCKLFTGSFGTLGVLTEATLRLAPAPESAATFLASGSFDRVVALAAELSGSFLLPAAVALLSPRALPVSPEVPTVAVWCEGFAAAVARHLRDLGSMAKRSALSSEVLEDEGHRRFWTAVGDFPLGNDGAVYRLTVPLSAVGTVVKTLTAPTGPAAPRVVAHADSGTIWVAPDEKEPAASFDSLAGLALSHRGHAMLFSRPPGLPAGLDSWRAPPDNLALMREIKRQFDPAGLLNPGRFVAGI
ncbi:MAG TPA: FAD-binding oxidoreductase [candidate division Zixibacteria bacterium]|nr:FAD-binding oxidoreductase [candidate division Zixibacteria bacterium]